MKEMDGTVSLASDYLLSVNQWPDRTDQPGGGSISLCLLPPIPEWLGQVYSLDWVCPEFTASLSHQPDTIPVCSWLPALVLECQFWWKHQKCFCWSEQVWEWTHQQLEGVTWQTKRYVCVWGGGDELMLFPTTAVSIPNSSFSVKASRRTPSTLEISKQHPGLTSSSRLTRVLGGVGDVWTRSSAGSPAKTCKARHCSTDSIAAPWPTWPRGPKD